MGTTQQTLAGSPLFAAIDPDGLRRLLDVGRVEYWNEGALILEEGTEGPRMMVVLEGECEVIARDPSGVQRTLATLGPGEVLGEIALLLDLPRTATVRAKTDMRVFAMDRASFREMVDAGDPAALRFGLELSRVLADRLMKLNDVVVDLLMQADGAEPLQRFTKARQEIFTLWEYDA